MTTTLQERREQAAQVTKGISNDVIYRAIEKILRTLPAGSDLLDFGAGSGTLVTQLSTLKRFRTLSAVDILPRPPGLAEPIVWQKADLNQATDFADGSFDIIVSSEVIEHLENPRAVTREWFRLLRPGGTVVMSTPNCESWRSVLALYFSGHFAGFTEASYPAHITALMRKDLSRSMKEAGFDRVDFAFTDCGGIPKLPGATWQKISLGLLGGVRFSDNVIAIAHRP